MRIMYHNPTCGSGIEQIGYVFLFLLKKLGHEIDLWNTQCAAIQGNVMSKVIDDYDVVIFNDATRISFGRVIKKERNDIWSISHNGEPLPFGCKQLSLNYPHQYQYLFRNDNANIMLPLTYPYAFGDDEFNVDRPHKFVFSGRWLKEKFHPHVRREMEENGIKLDMAFLTHVAPDYDIGDFAEEQIGNAKIDDMYSYLRSTKYLLLPSISECISLVVGEALANGCIPVIMDSKAGEHGQFLNCITAHSATEFAEVVKELDTMYGDPECIDRKKIFDFSKKMWSIEKSMEELRTIFGEGDGGKINVMRNDVMDMAVHLPYINASIITGGSF
jgi:hypothetical protein